MTCITHWYVFVKNSNACYQKLYRMHVMQQGGDKNPAQKFLDVSPNFQNVYIFFNFPDFIQTMHMTEK